MISSLNSTLSGKIGNHFRSHAIPLSELRKRVETQTIKNQPNYPNLQKPPTPKNRYIVNPNNFVQTNAAKCI